MSGPDAELGSLGLRHTPMCSTIPWQGIEAVRLKAQIKQVGPCWKVVRTWVRGRPVAVADRLGKGQGAGAFSPLLFPNKGCLAPQIGNPDGPLFPPSRPEHGVSYQM